jgi:MOSC domain-containing protein YiiM
MLADSSTTPLDEVTAALTKAVETHRSLAQQVKGDAATRIATFADGNTVDAASLVRHGVHDALHHLRDVARGFVAVGAGVASPNGVVEQISASGGGVPKTAVPEARVGYRGVDGDKQKTRRHHGRVWQALCLMTAEGIERMQREGHPIGFGSAGENVTIRGLDWAALRPGTRVQIGEVVCELSVPALPCNNNARWFSDGDFMRMHHEQHPGETRWYASVMRDGMVRAGDEVVVEPE